MDTITIQDLEVSYRVGVSDAERERPQRLQLTIQMLCDLGVAGASDDLQDTIDYHAVVERFRGFGDGREWKLIERLASDVADTVLDEFSPQSVCVEVKKFILPQVRYVSVEVTRDRK